ncbi:unannotated protein [freshwater metagenome]|uniref:Unannotated protein n=1 Tax=freshwater metagenome TaxID=449393 RepID=A0A6J6M749_9ZZZZ
MRVSARESGPEREPKSLASATSGEIPQTEVCAGASATVLRSAEGDVDGVPPRGASASIEKESDLRRFFDSSEVSDASDTPERLVWRSLVSLAVSGTVSTSSTASLGSGVSPICPPPNLLETVPLCSLEILREPCQWFTSIATDPSANCRAKRVARSVRVGSETPPPMWS